MSQIEGFAGKHSNGAGTRRYMGTPRKGKNKVGIHVLKEITSKVELVRQPVKRGSATVTACVGTCPTEGRETLAGTQSAARDNKGRLTHS